MIPLPDVPRPLHRRLYDSVRDGILAGRLAPGSRLPSTRQLAQELGISRTPVLEAYAQLWAEGYVMGRTGSGTYVAEVVPDRLLHSTRVTPSAPRSPVERPDRLSAAANALLGEDHFFTDPRPSPGAIAFEIGRISAADFPVTTWRRLLSKHLSGASHGYGPVAGHPALRASIADYLAAARAIDCSPKDVFIVGGGRRGLDVVTRLLVDRGDLVAIEEPHYPGARRTFLAAGARLVPIPVDQDGLDIEQLRSAPGDIGLVYVTPSHQFPTGAILPASRRLDLIAWARETGAMILEDDYDAEFQFASRPIEALRSLDGNGSVVYVGTFSKVLSADLRLGYVVVPPSLREALTRLIEVTDRQCSQVLQGALAEFFQSGHYGRHVRRIRRRHAARRAALLASLEAHLGTQHRVEGAAAGVHVLVWFEDVAADRADELVTEAAQRGVEVRTVARAYLGAPPAAGIVLGYGGLSERQIEEGVRRLASAVAAL